MMVVTDRGIMPVEGVGGESFFGATIKRLPLLRGEALRPRQPGLHRKVTREQQHRLKAGAVCIKTKQRGQPALLRI